MVKSMFAAVSGLKSHQQMLDVIGNNIANVNTYGFKAGSIIFQDAIYQSLKTGTGGEKQDGKYGGQNPSLVGYGVEVGSISYDFGQGGASATGWELDCMIDGSGFFIVGPYHSEDLTVGEDGSSSGMLLDNGLQLSRVGRFFTDSNGCLVDVNRNYIYGYACTGQGGADGDPTFEDTLSPIGKSLEDLGLEENEVISSYRIQADGTVIGTTSGGATDRTLVVGKIALASVQNPNGLDKTSSFYYNVSDNSGNVTVVECGGSSGSLQTGMLEMAKVDLATEFAQLILAQRGYQASTKIITVTDEILEQLVNMKR